MIEAALLHMLRDPRTVINKVLAWLVTLPPALYLVVQNGKYVGALKQQADGRWQFSDAANKLPIDVGVMFVSPDAFLLHCREHGLLLRLEHVPFPD